eukprot:525674_1
MFLTKPQQNRVREHLLEVLHKYSDADSNILCDYIITLLARDVNQKQIQKDCESELSIFMTTKTQQFVDELFRFIDKSNGKKQKQKQKLQLINNNNINNNNTQFI